MAVFLPHIVINAKQFLFYYVSIFIRHRIWDTDTFLIRTLGDGLRQTARLKDWSYFGRQTAVMKSKVSSIRNLKLVGRADIVTLKV